LNYILTKKIAVKLSLPFFIVSSLVLVVALVAVFRISDFDPYSISKQVNVKVEKEIILKIGENGETLILDQAGNVLLNYPKEEENFVSTVTKVLERDRKKIGVLNNSSVLLRLSNSDRISIFDPQTERQIDLAGFGEGNIQVFYDLLN
tara:strand:- start:847 stop:1290 length:444 start_codon:yes stop_codon:yes gene_type:complete